MAKKAKTKEKARQRRERRFEPRITTSPALVYALGAIGAAAMGAGAFEQLSPLLRDDAPEPLKAALYILAGGAVLVGIAIWLGTSSEPVLRVGDGGIAAEKSGVRRMPWYAVEQVQWRDGAIRVSGKDEAGADLTIVAQLSTQPFAAAWIVKEARDRVPGAVDVPADIALPEPLASEGEAVTLEPPQVVGRRCAASGKIIAFEPEARLCPRCDRAYHKAHVPETCACGASLEALRSASKS
jgi:hypothetical protein